jgi:hypothetical protein
MLALDPALGRTETIASLTTTTTVVSSLAAGGSAQRFVNDWMARFDTATTADRIRRIVSFTPAMGTLTHAGTNYADTTATSELVDILKFEPYLYANAVNVTLARLKHNSRVIIPTRQDQDTVWLSDLDWIQQPSDILRVCWSTNPVLTKNRYFRDYSSYNTSGVLKPDFWSITGASATMARSTSQYRRGQTDSLAITRSGTDCYVSQASGILDNGISADNLRGKSVVAVAWCWSAVASQVRVSLYDGVTTTTGSFHTGGSGWEELSATATVGAAATTLEMRVNVITDNTVAYVSEAYMLEGTATTDEVRRDNFESTEEEMPRGAYEQNGSLAAVLPARSRGGQWVIWSKRGYPQLDPTRFAAGTADADVIDAPLIPMATGSIARLYESLIDPEKPDTGPRYGPLAALWNERFDQLGATHLSPDRGPQHLGALDHRLTMTLSAPAMRY